MASKSNIPATRVNVSLKSDRSNSGYARYIDHVISAIDRGGIHEIETCSGRPAGTHVELTKDGYVVVPNHR